MDGALGGTAGDAFINRYFRSALLSSESKFHGNFKFYDMGGHQTGELYQGKFYDVGGHQARSLYPRGDGYGTYDVGGHQTGSVYPSSGMD